MGQAVSTDPAEEQYQEFMISWAKCADTDGENEPEDVINATQVHAERDSLRESWELARVLPYRVDGQDPDFLKTLLQQAARGETADSAIHPTRSLTGRPQYPCYVNRQLPGRVIRHTWDGHPTNAVVWSMNDPESLGEDRAAKQEVARSIVGDLQTQNAPVRLGTQAEYYDPKFVQPITTKAGSRLWSISLVAPPSTSSTAPSITDLKVSYPGQLLVRIDEGRQMLIYDAFDYQSGPSAKDLQATYDQTGQLPCTEDELQAVEFLLKKACNKDNLLMSREHMLKPLNSLSHSIQERIQKIGFPILVPLLQHVRFKRSRIYRVRFSIDAICGARLLEFSANRPQAAIAPLPKSDLPVSSLGEYGHDDEDQSGGRALPGTFEACDESIEQLGMLVLEFERPGQALETVSFASTIACPINHLDRKRVPLTVDWTPDHAFSKSSRHYIVGDASEIRELAEFLVQTNPRLKTLLAPHLLELEISEKPRVGKPKEDDESKQPPTKKARSQRNIETLEEALRAANTLGGPISSVTDLDQNIPAMQSLTSKTAFQILNDHGILPLQDNGESKDEVVSSKPFQTTKDVHDFLKRCGIKHYRDVNPCFKAGLLNNAIHVPREFLVAGADASAYLDCIICTPECLECEVPIPVSVRDALEDMTGKGSYWDCDGTVKCPECEEELVVTQLCQGTPSLDSGKFHNHCMSCPDFGDCVGDYRTSHCDRCGEHYFQGISGFSCSCTGKAEAQNGWEDDDDESYTGEGEYFECRNDSGDLTHLFDPPSTNAWSGLCLSEAYTPPGNEDENQGGDDDSINDDGNDGESSNEE